MIEADEVVKDGGQVAAVMMRVRSHIQHLHAFHKQQSQTMLSIMR